MILNVKKDLIAFALGNDMMLNVLLYYVLTALLSLLLLGLTALDIWVISLYDLVNLSSFFRSVNALFSKLRRSASEDVFIHYDHWTLP